MAIAERTIMHDEHLAAATADRRGRDVRGEERSHFSARCVTDEYFNVRPLEIQRSQIKKFIRYFGMDVRHREDRTLEYIFPRPVRKKHHRSPVARHQCARELFGIFSHASLYTHQRPKVNCYHGSEFFSLYVFHAWVM